MSQDLRQTPSSVTFWYISGLHDKWGLSVGTQFDGKPPAAS